MTLAVLMYSLVVGGLGKTPQSTDLIAPKVWSALFWVEIVLGPAMMVVSLRFLRLRRWTRVPLIIFGIALILGMLAFSVFWVFKMSGFFHEMRGGPPLDATGSAVVSAFQVVMTIGGVVVSLAFAAGFGILTGLLRKGEVREAVIAKGF